jgi:hypothetical protein
MEDYVWMKTTYMWTRMHVVEANACAEHTISLHQNQTVGGSRGRFWPATDRCRHAAARINEPRILPPSASGTLQGVLTSAEGESLPGATVQLVDTQIGPATRRPARPSQVKYGRQVLEDGSQSENRTEDFVLRPPASEMLDEKGQRARDDVVAGQSPVATSVELGALLIHHSHLADSTAAVGTQGRGFEAEEDQWGRAEQKL